MIHKFISNDNKGNVNTLEIGSDYTKISKVVDPVNDDDVANKKYVDQAVNNIVLNATTACDGSNQNYDIIITSALPSASDLESYFNDNRSIVLHFTNVPLDARLQPELKEVDSATGTYYSFIGEGVGSDYDKLKYVIQFNVDNVEYVSCFGKVYIRDKYIVTLTPTSPDYSGTMDKTVAEINAAYEAGQEIWFKVGTEAQGYAYVPANQISLGNKTYPSFEATLLNPGVGLMYAFTAFTDDGTKQTYHTDIYSLTPRKLIVNNAN